jgi:serine/threonine protein kinase, bacterial
LNGIYEIERLIAEGGMGEVYKGVAVTSGDPVAIKLVRPDMSRHPDVMAMFNREAAILHNLQHDAIPRYYVFTVEPELQRSYIAMEFVDGVSLQKRLEAGPLPSAEVRVLLKRIGGALELAHANGVVHRDISSDNIILPNGDPRRAKIVDFGIARAPVAGEGTIIGGGFAGKYKYVSPEQLGLAGGEVTPQSDIYSFGLVIAEALRGQPIDMGSTQAEVIEKRKRVPDLSDIDFSLRPLLTAMMAPNPADRPASMAEIAAWGETVERTQIAAAAAPAAPPPAQARIGRTALIAAAVAIVVLLAAGLGLREVFAPGIIGSPSPTLPTLPPTSPAASSPTAPSPTQLSGPHEPPVVPRPETPTATPTTERAEKPTVDALIEQLPPKAAQSDFTLPPAAVGAPLRVELPAFADPGGKGLALHVTPSAPPGLVFRDTGGGRAALEGTPTEAGRFAFDVVAVNQNGKSAHMKVAITATGAPPKPAQNVVDLDPAMLGSPYSAALPPFRSPERLALRAERLPEGLAFADLGGGLSQLTGQPAKAGHFAFNVVASAPGGAEARMTVNLVVAPPQTATSEPTQTPGLQAAAQATPTPVGTPEMTIAASPAPALSPTPSMTSAAVSTPSVETFLRGYDNAPCFAVHRQADVSSAAFAAISADRGAFQRFAAEYSDTFRRDPDVRAMLVTSEQCPAAELLKQAPASAAGPPRLTLDSTQVGKGRPLAGAITELRGRALLLLAIVDDGRAVKLRVQPAPGGDSASFSLALSGDADSFGKPEVLLAIVSDRPMAGLDAFRSGPSADILSKIAVQWREVGGSAALALFKLAE